MCFGISSKKTGIKNFHLLNKKPRQLRGFLLLLTLESKPDIKVNTV
ncbi:hypothetical protein J610_0862 [Acinetobacter sp. 723929]|nr:hypothetical protein HMPREF0013_01065 [Acinetobacter sp. SH024]EXA91067.1 hypothetical protein J508_0833 [Acinetobacter sp. 1289694]EXB78947.1 hypothetical protein J551_0799 [Acinetobacter sp. 1475718]EXI18324.1 hypothetical protein J610_0862 [Acinetobacter sp. 723929]EXS00754.1 hypothetical protein J687_1760 [Acinetobacter sp. 225588]EXS35358.1 hypothetical protein J663_1269 [Acinetobacter sp. 826659]EYT45106.1 hypothetical protein J619_02469 [Acinetobacter sp. 478810]KCX62847.1 hypothet